jgi:prepilin peptidase CpaA
MRLMPSLSYSEPQRVTRHCRDLTMNEIEAIQELLLMLILNPGTGVLIALLLVAAWTDWRTMRIPNWLTVSGMAWGLAFNAMHSTSVGNGLMHGGAGLLTGLVLLMPLYAIRVLGAGDVKLLAMVGAFIGAFATLQAALVVGIVGGLAAVSFAISRRVVPQLAANAKDIVQSLVLPGVPMWRPGMSGTSIGKLPYGISISAGTIVFLTLRQLGFA